jgi:predicted RNA binding protein YcfA (HicA-like mRNA interferase family)
VPRALPVVSGADVVRALVRLGFAQVGQRGSHVKLRDGTGRTVIVPMHREVAEETLRSVLRQAGTDADAFKTALES